ncbi:MAG: TrmH family RNA methyltransferase, partial [Candidatus Nanoarchaeia archaeon]
NPKCDHLSKEALDRASHAKEILKKAEIMSFSDLVKEFDYVVGTSAVVGTDYNIPRSPLTPDKLRLPNKDVVVVFGREDHGLANDEILKCDFVVTIPASKKYASMNISHAAAIIFYEIFKKSREEKISSHIVFASRRDKDILLKLIYSSLDRLDFSTKKKKETQKKVWKRLIGKAFLTKREIFALCGYFRKIR